MPTYLCHGFRWHRPNIRIFVILKDVDNAAPEWIVAPDSGIAVLDAFYRTFDFLPEVDPDPARFHVNEPLPPATKPAGDDDDDDDEGTEPSPNKASPSGPGPGPGPDPDPDPDPDPESTPTTPAAAQFGGRPSSAKTQQPSSPAKAGTELPDPDADAPAADLRRTARWSAVQLLEQYDPADFCVSQPYAYVADHVVPIDLSASVVEEMAGYEAALAATPVGERAMIGDGSDESGRRHGMSALSPQLAKREKGTRGTGWLERLRDELEKDEEIRWYVVVCGELERRFSTDEVPDSANEEKKTETETETGGGRIEIGDGSLKLLDEMRKRRAAAAPRSPAVAKPPHPAAEPRQPQKQDQKRDSKQALRSKPSKAAGLRKLFSRKETREST